MLDLFANELAGLRGWRLSLAFGVPSAFDGLLLRHHILL
jgi:hypothetical protein